jgi:hypothetical protein
MKLAKAHKLSRRTYFRGLHISIETDKGELRHWYDKHNDERGSTKMKYPYGYIRRTKGVDGDHVDVYVGPNKRAKNVYIIHQMKAPEFKKYDEDKCMLGFLSAQAAKVAYLGHYNDRRFFGTMTVMPFEEFEKKVLHSFDLKKPHKIAATPMQMVSKTLGLWPTLPEIITGETTGDTALEQLIEQVSPEEEPPTIEPAATQVPQAPPLPPEILAEIARQRALQQAPESRKEGSMDNEMLKKAYALGVSLAQEHHGAIQAREKQAVAALRQKLGQIAPGGPRREPLAGTIFTAPPTAQEEMGPGHENLRRPEPYGQPPPPSRTGQPPAQPGPFKGAADAQITGTRGNLLKAKTMTMPKPNTSSLPKTPKLQNVMAKLSENKEASAITKRMERLAREAAEIGGIPGIPAPRPEGTLIQRLGSKLKGAFTKQNQSLGDPMFWQGGEQAAAGAPPAASAEEVVTQLPLGTFQGMNTKISPEGDRSTSVKVTPDALGSPEMLAAIFQVEPGAKVELETPEQPTAAVAGGPIEGGAGGPPLPEGMPQDAAAAPPPPEPVA